MKKILFLFAIIYSNLAAQNCTESTHSTNINDSWLSCDVSANPNTQRANSHWVMYDLGYLYKLKSTKFWNFNQNGQTNNGMKDIVIDYSLDGITWQEATNYQLSEATGTSNYNGEDGPNLNGLQARYVLITALNTWGGTCAGLSEAKFDVDDQVAILELAEDNYFLTLSPNPAKESIRVSTDFDYAELILVSAVGTEIMRTKQQNNFIDVSYLPVGVYFIKLVNRSNETKTATFIKEAN